VAFAAGRATAPAAASAAGRIGFGQGGAGTGPAASGAPGRGQGFGGGFGGTVSVQGTVEAIDGSSMTIKLPSGQTVTIAINGATTYHSQAPATATDVTSGSAVIVQLVGRGLPGGGPAASDGPAPAASGAPAGGTGTAGSITVVPAGS
jgi:hypothetical protein